MQCCNDATGIFATCRKATRNDTPQRKACLFVVSNSNGFVDCSLQDDWRLWGLLQSAALEETRFHHFGTGDATTLGNNMRHAGYNVQRTCTLQ